MDGHAVQAKIAREREKPTLSSSASVERLNATAVRAADDLVTERSR
ncbi:hypothetical protein [Actinoplanes sp. NPDC051411]